MKSIINIAIGMALILSTFIGLGWTWTVNVTLFFIGLGLMLYLAYYTNGVNKRPNMFHECVGYSGALITLGSMAIAIGHVIYWVIF